MSDQLDLFDIAQIEAMDSVLEPDWEYTLRQVCRWYSKEFNCPLYEAEELPVFYLFRHYWESHYEQMEEDERIKAAKRLAETPAQRLAREAEEKALEEEDEEFLRQVREEVEKAEKGAKKLSKTVQDMGAKLAEMSAPEELPPDIKFDCVSPEEEKRIEDQIEASQWQLFKGK